MTKVVSINKTWWQKEREPAKAMEMAKPPKLSNEYYSVQQVADRFQVSISRIYEYIGSGRLDAVRLGRTYRISREALETFLLNCRGKQGA